MVGKKEIFRVLESIISEDDLPQENKKKILIVSSESAPYATVGGVSSVVLYLSRALMRLGHDVRIFMPKYGSIDEGVYKTSMVCEGLKVPTGDSRPEHLVCNVKIAQEVGGVPTYFLENHEYYEKRANVYGYSDDSTRWALLSRGLLEFLRTGVFVPNVIHCNDWHTALVPNYLKTEYAKDPLVENITTVFTIHSLKYQGGFVDSTMSELDFDDGKSSIASFFSDRLTKQNFVKRGILYSDVVNTVSKTYAREIMTPEFGENLDKLLLEVKDKVFGIVNGLDYDVFNPSTDDLIYQNYDLKSIDLRSQNKMLLQEEFGLPVNKEIPLLGFVGRLDHQKGVDLLVETLHHVMKNESAQFVHVGGGDSHLADMLTRLRDEFPKSVGVHTYPNFTLPRKMFAGTDMMLVPSRFEPCGVVQLEAMRYGSVPIVRNVGGLSDTVIDFPGNVVDGTGFVFQDFDTYSLYGTIIKALHYYKNPKTWRKIQENSMKADYSWKFSAKEYEKLYFKSKSFRKANEPFDRPKQA